MLGIFLFVVGQEEALRGLEDTPLLLPFLLKNTKREVDLAFLAHE
jgi:hypothetical protein